jgi:hypothetical protein
MSTPELRLETIQSMLFAGHRSVRLERHSLLLWGGVGGFLCAATQPVVTVERFPELQQRATALLVWLAFWLGSAACADHYLTRRVRRLREETLPFAQHQITRAWWMLLAMGVLGSVAMSVHGGAHMVYALWTVLLGLGIYLFGLFSRPLTEWIGLATILLGVGGLASGLPFGTTRWLAASCFAIGLPLAGVLGARTEHGALPVRLSALAVWLLLVTGVPLSLASVSSWTPVPAAMPRPLSGLAALAGEQVVSLPAGTAVPLRLDLDSPLLTVAPQEGLPLTLNRSIEIALRDGRPDGRYRLAGGTWHQMGEGLLQLRIDRLAPQLERGEPAIRAHAVFGETESAEELP